MFHDRNDLVLIVAADYGIGMRHSRIIIVVTLVLYKVKKTEPLRTYRSDMENFPIRRQGLVELHSFSLLWHQSSLRQI